MARRYDFTMIDEGATLDSAAVPPDPPERRPTNPSDADAVTMPVRESSTRSLGGGGASEYQMVKILGEGGFGSVWLARQTAPLQRDVAIKVLKRGMDSEAIVARFNAERQALAVLDHPSLAKVYDAGTTKEGLPFFAMEFVAGEPIDAFADRHTLTIRQRIDLVIQVAEAVQHAHTKGLIHRDLKPPNIIVTREGTGYRAKVIDFGIAKVVNAATSGESATLVGQVLGSPDYMAPEQAEPSGIDVDIDTRVDVWALGVVLYELLTGSLPFQKGLLRTAGIEEWRRQLRESVPQRPSTRIRTGTGLPANTDPSTLAEHRGIQPRELASTLHGDLDWVVMRCLERDRERRYAGPSALADDLRRYLRGDPVEAGPPTVRYRAGKFLRKYRVPVAFASVALVMLVVALVVSVTQLRESERQRARAKATLISITEAMGKASPEQGGSTAIDFGRFLKNVEQEARELAAEEPATASAFLHEIGALRVTARDFDGAKSALEQAIALREAVVDDPEVGPSRLAASHHEYARALFFLDRVKEAAQEYEAAMALWNIESDKAQRAESMLHLSSVYARLEDHERSAASFEVAIALMREAHGPAHVKLADAYYARALQSRKAGRLEEALRDLTESLAILTPQASDKDYRVGQALRRLGDVQAQRGQLASACGNYARALPHLQGQLGDDHATVCDTRDEYGELLLRADRPQEALAVAREALASRRRLGDKPAKVVGTLDLCGRAALAANEPREAKTFLEEALATQRAVAPGGGLKTGEIALLLADAILRSGAPQSEALPFIREAIEEGSRLEGGSTLVERANALGGIQPNVKAAP